MNQKIVRYSSRPSRSVLCGKTNVPTPIQDGQNQTEIFEFRAQKLAFQGSLAYLTETQTNFSNSFSFSRKPFYRFVTWIDLMEIFQEPNSSSDVQRRTVVAQKLAFLGSLSYLRESQTDLPNSVSSSRKDLRRFVTWRDGNLPRFVSLAFGLSPRSMTARQPIPTASSHQVVTLFQISLDHPAPFAWSCPFPRLRGRFDSPIPRIRNLIHEDQRQQSNVVTT